MDQQKHDTTIVLNDLLLNPHYDSTIAAELLIDEILRLGIDFRIREDLLTQLIDDPKIPEVYGQTLLYLKAKHYFDAGKLDDALVLLNDLDNQDHRLTCFTKQYFELCLFKSDILLRLGNYPSSYAQLKKLEQIYFNEQAFEAFQAFPEASQLRASWFIMIAMVAHACGDNKAYRLFKQAMDATEHPLKFDLKNKNLAILFSNECVRQGEYQEALSVFKTLILELKSQSKIDKNNNEAMQFMMTMIIMIRFLNHEASVQEELDDFQEFVVNASIPLPMHVSMLREQALLCIDKIERHQAVVAGEVFRPRCFSPTFEKQLKETALTQKKLEGFTPQFKPI